METTRKAEYRAFLFICTVTRKKIYHFINFFVYTIKVFPVLDSKERDRMDTLLGNWIQDSSYPDAGVLIREPEGYRVSCRYPWKDGRQ